MSRDRGHDPLSSEATVVVHIDDINDNAPSVTIRTLHGSTETELPESSAIGSFVAHVSVVDQDSAASGLTNCSVSHSSVFTLQRNEAALVQRSDKGHDLDADVVHASDGVEVSVMSFNTTESIKVTRYDLDV